MKPLEVQEESGILSVSFEGNKSKKSYFIIKRIFDILVGVLGIIILIPMAIIVKIANMLTGDFAPMFLIQNRIGKDGKTIRIFKFRSMIPNAETILDNMMENDSKIKEEYLKNKKLEDDPRITKVGKIIRKMSIDEFPQFINVLKGDMSLVGPRPYLFREKDDMGDFYKSIIKCKPGITGLWQVSGRSDVSFNYRLKMDKLYFLERTLKFDFDIILKTFKAVLWHKGAK